MDRENLIDKTALIAGTVTLGAVAYEGAKKIKDLLSERHDQVVAEAQEVEKLELESESSGDSAFIATRRQGEIVLIDQLDTRP